MTMGWMGNYESGKSRFVPCADGARLVTPALAFVPDSAGGCGMPSVTGDRHDQVAKEAPAWFKTSVQTLASMSAGQIILARITGTAGKYRFWSSPVGVQSPADWETATAKEIRAFKLEQSTKAAEKAAADAEWATSFVAAQAALASDHGWVVVDTRPGRALYPDGHVTIAMAEDGRVFEIRSVPKMMGRGYTHDAAEVAS
ncbi:hypothetical protein BLL52_4292 [Rhodoferax antarcticus ANT.BR]|uniref:Uncharacterized protein n=2 Tax=Rhodoferax antarcticus TaxID=81479 RepID=A0A1Q8Y999_9BURK|nr:hypothetical protein BLL52_4292 [Rhodoferax antarcticus ANT.BR]